MEKEQHLKEIINEEESTKRTEKSKYFTEEFFELCGIKKYRKLFEEYDEIIFNRRTFCKIEKDEDEENDTENYSSYDFDGSSIPISYFKYASYISFLSFDDESVEEGYNLLMDIDEAYDRSISEEERRKRGNPYGFTDTLITISYFYNVSYIFMSKENGIILKYYGTDEGWKWKVLANSFDEFIDNLYVIIPEEKKKLSEKEEKNLREFAENLLEEVEKIRGRND